MSSADANKTSCLGNIKRGGKKEKGLDELFSAGYVVFIPSCPQFLAMHEENSAASGIENF